MQAGIETLQDNLLVVCFIERTLLMASMASWHVLAHAMWHHPIRSLLDAGMQLAELTANCGPGVGMASLC